METRRKLDIFTILEDSNELIRKKERIKLTPKEMGVLVNLLDNSNTTLTRVQLLESVWGHELANDQGLTQAISRLRKIFSKSKKIRIKTIPKKGYQLQVARDKKKQILQQFMSGSTLFILAILIFLYFLIAILPFGVRIQVEKAPHPENVSISK